MTHNELNNPSLEEKNNGGESQADPFIEQDGDDSSHVGDQEQIHGKDASETGEQEVATSLKKSGKTLVRVLYAIAVAALILSIFQIGMLVGLRRGSFGCRWGNEYEPLFRHHSRGVMMPMPREFGIPDPNGAAGVVIRVQGNDVFVRGNDGNEKHVFLQPSTQIRRGIDQISAQQVRPDDHLVIFGHPDAQGDIQAQFIRVFEDIR